MSNLLKNRKTQIIGTVVLAVVAVVVLFFAYNKEPTYASMRDDDMRQPALAGTYFGMPLREFCAALGMEEQDLIKAPTIDLERYFRVDRLEAYYNKTKQDLIPYERLEHQYYIRWDEPLYGSTKYFADDQPSTVRVIFTNETTYNGKTIPPLLCAIFIDYSMDQLLSDVHDVINEEIDGKSEVLGRGKHARAELLSYLYASGMSPEEIADLNVLKMDEKEVDHLRSEIFGDAPIAILSPVIRVDSNYVLDKPMVQKINQYVVTDAYYYAYYEWFLNELT